MKYVELSGTNGGKMPVVGLGTWRATPEETDAAVLAALDAGYTHIDTAFNYNTEEAIGRTLRRWVETGKGKREDLFITTKLPNFGNRPEDVERFLRMSLERLQLDYVDLYLIHMPFSFLCSDDGYAPAYTAEGAVRLDVDHDIVDTWKMMEGQVHSGLARSIGLSNFNAEQMQKVYDNATIKPAVLQVELHAYLQQKELRAFCDKLNIAITAYAPLGSPGANNHFSSKYNYFIDDYPDILGHPVVNELAAKHHKSPGQILLRHLVQGNLIVIPKSGNPERIANNIDIFDFVLTNEDMAKLDALDKGEDGRIFDFLFLKGVEKHPEYPFKNRLHGW